MYQDWLFKDHPSGWRLRYRRNGGGYEASRDGENWQPVPSVTQITGLLNKNLHEWAVRQVVEYLKGELVPGLVLTEEEAEARPGRGGPGPPKGGPEGGGPGQELPRLGGGLPEGGGPTPAGGGAPEEHGPGPGGVVGGERGAACPVGGGPLPPRTPLRRAGGPGGPLRGEACGGGPEDLLPALPRALPAGGGLRPGPEGGGPARGGGWSCALREGLRGPRRCPCGRRRRPSWASGGPGTSSRASAFEEALVPDLEGLEVSAHHRPAPVGVEAHLVPPGEEGQVPLHPGPPEVQGH